MSERLEALARRVQDDPFFLASALAEYAGSEDLDQPGMARVLGCAIHQLPRLALCRRPRAETFREDIERIAARFGIQSGPLAEVVRQADTLAAWRDSDSRGWLQAARDRTPSDAHDAHRPPRGSEGP